jgi:hypothetical protein
VKKSHKVAWTSNTVSAKPQDPAWQGPQSGKACQRNKPTHAQGFKVFELCEDRDVDIHCDDNIYRQGLLFQKDRRESSMLKGPFSSTSI